MLNKVATIERESPKYIKLFGSRQIPGLVTSGEFCQISLTTGHSRSENPGGGALAVCASADNGNGNLLEGRGESMLCSGTDLESNCEKIEQRGEGLNILQALSSEYDLKRNHHHLMSRQNSPQEEKYISKRKRFNAERGENLGLDEGENVAAADRSDSTMKGSDLTAERTAEGSSRTTSSSENNGKLDPPPMTATNLSSLRKEKLKGTCVDSGLQETIRTSIDDGQTVHRSEGFSSSSRPASGKDEDWLALGLDSGYRSHEPMHPSNKLSLDATNKVMGPILRWNKEKDTEDQRRQQTQMLNSGHAVSKFTTLLQPSYPIQPASARQLSFRADIANYSNARPLLQGPPMANRISFQKNITDSSNFSALNLLQPCTMEDQQNSQNTAVFPSLEQNFLYQRHIAGTSLVSQADAASWQGFYDRISEARIPGRTDLCFSDPRMGSFKGSQGHRFPQGLRSLIAGTSDAHSNSEADSLVCAGLGEAGMRDSLEKMQCRTQWNSRDNLSPWYNPGSSLGSLIRPNASEIGSIRFPTDDRTLPFRQQQHQQRNLADPARDSQRFPGVSWTENVRILKSSRAAQTGLWFVLQASNNQNGDRMLPQIPRNYLRIKDGTMTILVVKKYLANKLGLNSESEIEIMCRGQKLLPSLTMQYVRDVMWPSTLSDHDLSRRVESNPSSTDHLMVLHYQRNNLNPAADAQF